MYLPVKARDLPGRVTTGAYILHSGLDKWRADGTRATALHGMAARAFPMLNRIPPARFLRLLAASEIAIGTALLAPVVPNALAGAALTGFSGSLVTMYAHSRAAQAGQHLAEPGRCRRQQGHLDAGDRPRARSRRLHCWQPRLTPFTNCSHD